MGIIQLEQRSFQDVQPVYSPWWDSVDDSTRTGFFFGIALLAIVSTGG